jgi:hypothetical protein
MAFDLTVWHDDLRAWLRSFAQNPQAALAQAGSNTVYGALLGASALPVVAAYATDPGSALTALVGVVGGVGVNLLSNLAQGHYDATNALPQLTRAAADPQQAAEFEQIATKLGLFALAGEELRAARQAAMLATLRAELSERGKLSWLEGATITQNQSGGVNFGVGNQIGAVGDVTAGDKVGSNKIVGPTIGSVSAGRDAIVGTNVTVNQGDNVLGNKVIRNVNTGGGDYAEGNMDKRSGTFVSDDQFTMSGTFSGAILNITATLTNVAQSIGAAPLGDTATKAQLQALIAQLSAELHKVPPRHVAEAEAIAETAKAAVEQATKAQPNTPMVQISAEGLKQAAQNLAAVLPTVVPLAERVADMLRKMIGV